MTDPDRIARHAFFPLIGYQLAATKVRRDESRRRIFKSVKTRQIRYAAHLDAHIYSYYNQLLAGLYEAELHRLGLSRSVLAFRKLGESNIEFASMAFEGIRELGNCTALAFDVTGFFDNIDHALLRKSWCRLLGRDSLPSDHFAVFRSLTRYSLVDRNTL